MTINSIIEARQVDIVIFQPIVLEQLPNHIVKQPASMFQRLLESTY